VSSFSTNNSLFTRLHPDRTGSGVAGIIPKSTTNFHNGQWGTVCYYDGYAWDMPDAKVACRQLGFTKAVGYWWLGQGTGKVWLWNMQCVGTETSLESCTHNGLGSVASHCPSHTYDVGMVI
jgi:hypothetical protein